MVLKSGSHVSGGLTYTMRVQQGHHAAVGAEHAGRKALSTGEYSATKKAYFLLIRQ